MSVKGTRKERYAYLAWMLLALLTAVSLRLIALSTIPPGLTHDEADHGITAWSIVNGARALYFTIGYGREPLYDYATAVFMRFLGPTYLAGRVTAVYFSLILIVGMAAWVRRAFDWQTAVLTAAGLAAGFWPVMTARQSLRSITLPALFTLAVYLFWRGLEEVNRRRGHADARQAKSAPANIHPRPIFFIVAAGLVLGLTFYTYIPARLLWAVFPATLVYVGWQNRPLFRQTWRGMLLMLLLAALIGAPLFVYLAGHPDAETRIGQLSQPLTAVTQGNLAPLWQNTRAGLGILTFQGDGYWRYNIAGQPLLPPLMGVLFVAGLMLAMWWIGTGKRQTELQPAAAFLAMAWLLAGLAPVLVTGSRLSTTQAIGMQPVVYLFPALALRQLVGSFQNRVSGSRPTAYAAHIVLLLLFGGTAVATAINYFSVWANQPDVRVEYESTMVAAMQAIRTGNWGHTAVSTQTPRPYHTPAVAALTLPTALPAPRWFDARASLILPSAPQSFMLIPGFTPLNPALEPYFATAVLSQTLPLRPTDLDRPLAVYRLDGAQMAADWAQKFQTLPGGAVNFSDTAVFLGYDLQTPTAVAGDVITIATWWQAQRPLTDAVLFTQVMGPDGRPIAQSDRLDVPGESWQAGDQFIQLHQFTLPEATAVGQYPIIIGLYTCPAGCPQTQAPQRLPILSPAGLPADYLPLTELSVSTP